ncbi:MAG: hypothetical protein RL238_720 [Actinomycetota bacterium]|jgi:hypothetical protein
MDLKLGEVTVRMGRKVALSRSQATISADSLESFASDSYRASSAAFSLVRDWIDYTKSVTDGCILVRIDDLDLAARRVDELIEDIRILVSSPRICVIVALDIEEIRRVLFLQQNHRDYDASTLRKTLKTGREIVYAEQAVAAVEGQLTKLLRPDLRVVLDELSTIERLSFTPISGVSSILDLLRAIELHPGKLPRTLGDLFASQEGESVVPTLYADCLSSNRRRLAVLHRQLSALDGPRNDQLERAAQLLVQHGVSEGLRTTGVLGLRESDFIRFGTDEFGEPEVFLDFSNLAYFGGGARRSYDLDGGRAVSGFAAGKRAAAEDSEQEHVALDGKHTIRLRVDSRSFAKFRMEDGSEGASVSLALSESMLLAREFGVVDAMGFPESLRGIPPRQGGSRKRLVQIDKTDDQFVQLPLWDGYYDYWLLTRFWADVARRLDLLKVAPTDAAALGVAALIAAVVEITTSRSTAATGLRVAGWSNKVAVSRELAISIDEAWTCYQQVFSLEDVRSRDFFHYFEDALPMVFHPLLVGENRWRELFGDHLRHLAEVGRLDVARPSLAEDLNLRCVQAIGEDWVDPLVECIEMLDEERGRVARARQERARSRQLANRPEALGGELLSYAAGSSNTADQDRLTQTVRSELAALQKETEHQIAIFDGH